MDAATLPLAPSPSGAVVSNPPSTTFSTGVSDGATQPSAWFPLLPLTETFTPPSPRCTSLTSLEWPVDDLLFATERTCFPPGHTFGPSGFFFSPGIACPQGHRTACQDARGVASVTTVTCCPVLENMPDMQCMETNLDDPNLQNFQCSVTAPATGMEVPVFVTNDVHNYDAYTLTSLIASPSVIYALGVKMVYQATDLPTRPTTSIDDGSSIDDSSITTPTISSTSSEVATGASLATGAVVAIGVTIPLAVLGASVAAFLVWRRKRRQRQSRAEADDWLKSHELPTKPHERLLPKRLYEMSGYGVMAEMPAKRETVELPG